MNKFAAWGAHAAGSIIVALFATGILYNDAIIPHVYQAKIVAAVMVIGYMLGVNFQRPGRSAKAPPAQPSNVQTTPSGTGDNPFHIGR